MVTRENKDKLVVKNEKRLLIPRVLRVPICKVNFCSRVFLLVVRLLNR